jgi:fructose-1-phosphate kinase PfkB-like protein
MFVTLTLNPCIDLNLEVEDFRFDEPLRALRERKRPGGKGINVSVVLGILGMDSVAVAPLGGSAGEEFLQLAGKNLTGREPGVRQAESIGLKRLAEGSRAKTGGTRLAAESRAKTGRTRLAAQSQAKTGKMRLVSVSAAAPTRTNIVITSQRDGRHLKVNQRGGPLAPAELDAVFGRLRALMRPGDWLVLAGSLPPGAPDETYARLIREFQARGCFTALDADGEAFRLGVQAGPDIVKPNLRELEGFARRPLRTRAALLIAAGEILGMGTRLCLITDGPRAAWLVARGGAGLSATGPSSARLSSAGLFAAWKGIPPRAHGSPTGAGDAALAGLLAGLAAGRVSRRGESTSASLFSASSPSTPSTASTPSTKPGRPRAANGPRAADKVWNTRALEKAFRLALACGSASASTPDTEYFDPGLLKDMLKRAEIERIS